MKPSPVDQFVFLFFTLYLPLFDNQELTFCVYVFFWKINSTQQNMKEWIKNNKFLVFHLLSSPSHSVSFTLFLLQASYQTTAAETTTTISYPTITILYRKTIQWLCEAMRKDLLNCDGSIWYSQQRLVVFPNLDFKLSFMLYSISFHLLSQFYCIVWWGT